MIECVFTFTKSPRGHRLNTRFFCRLNGVNGHYGAANHVFVLLHRAPFQHRWLFSQESTCIPPTFSKSTHHSYPLWWFWWSEIHTSLFTNYTPPTPFQTWKCCKYHCLHFTFSVYQWKIFSPPKINIHDMSVWHA